MSRSVNVDYDVLRERQARAQQLDDAIKTRRLRKCIAEGAHLVSQPDAAEQAHCPRCGIAPAGADRNGS